jgi:CubicO group peptidase (beta-lactamase class C family)
LPATPVAAAPAPALPAIDELLATLYDGQPFRGAVLAARHGELLHSKGYGLADEEQQLVNTPATRFRLGSVTKPITAIALLQLHAAGQVDLQTSVCAYLSPCPSAWSPITLHHLLSHTSGIPDFTEFPDFATTKGQPSTPRATLARFAERPLDFAPGEQWRYSNSNYIVLGLVIEQVTGKPYESVVQEQLFAPLGMTGSGYDHNLDSLAVGYLPSGAPADFLDMSIPYAAGGLYSTVEDLYRLDRALVEGRLLTPELRAAMFDVQARFIPPEPPGGYGYGWTVMERPDGVWVGHNGSIEGFSAGIWHKLDEDLLIVVLSNEERRSPLAVVEGIARLLAEAGE